MPLTNKEQTLIEDNLNAEYLCVRKYEQYAAMASDQNLKQVFTDLANREVQHVNTLKGILSQNGVNSQNIFESYNKPQGDLSNMQNNLGITDAQLLNDALSTEKHVSSSYNTAVLESVDPNIRKQLQHIQQEEQNHAEILFKEMQSRGWYSVK
ncbi:MULTISPECIES: spore coat protein [Clostridium]|uniref:Coat F domain protein n=2 Tax=Clostridium TaxID=1485 RepID=A0A151AKW2_9CLOT|nr:MULTISPECIES: spore coat protein [Clostridium]KYH28289.1 coat F domain protein [Clostridium colicanis DSM 13634]MBE6043650.1 rubrerythrin family protein [Clostridium thermopalmarium]PRR74295.1 Coat F domain protein [Clostridium thermopalmarium DSM 5974]PVZ22083.1 rubrerythrin [Clostridium thermopalmarium DSM 5974]